MEAPGWLAPLSGAVAISAAVGTVGLWTWGSSLPEAHSATVTAVVQADADTVWALLSDPLRRPEWVPGVARVVEGEVDGRHAWRQVDASGDRFDFRIAAERPIAVIETARTEDLGMSARWTWRVEPAGASSTVVTVTEEGAIDNPLFRAMWALNRGPYVIVEADLRGLGRAVGSEVAVERVE